MKLALLTDGDYSWHGMIPPWVGIILACLVASPSGAATLTVTSTADTINGDPSSPAALVTNPGPDGISLREAIAAANSTPGPHTPSPSTPR